MGGGRARAGVRVGSGRRLGGRRRRVGRRGRAGRGRDVDGFRVGAGPGVEVDLQADDGDGAVRVPRGDAVADGSFLADLAFRGAVDVGGDLPVIAGRGDVRRGDKSVDRGEPADLGRGFAATGG